jgi:glycine cleavage system regulatory protein
MKVQRQRALAAIGIAVVGLLSGCASSSRSTKSAATQAPSRADSSGEAIKVAGQQPAVEGQVAAIPIDTGRALIVTASLKLRATDVAAAVNALTTIAVGQGGDIFNSQVRLEPPATASVQVRVPPSKLAETETMIGKLGTVTDLTQQVQDATEATADLDARIKTAQASVDRVRGFLDKATSLADLASIEAQVTQRETVLEQLQAQQRTLADQTGLSTLTVDISGPNPPATPAKTNKLPSILSGLKGGVNALVAVATVIGLILAATLPFLLVGLLIGIPIWRLWKRSGRQIASRSSGGTAHRLPASVADPVSEPDGRQPVSAGTGYPPPG